MIKKDEKRQNLLAPFPHPLPPSFVVHCHGPELLLLIDQLKAANALDGSVSHIAILARGRDNAHWIATVYTHPPVPTQATLDF